LWYETPVAAFTADAAARGGEASPRAAWDVIAIGSSRVATTIDEAVFAEALAAEGVSIGRVFNMASGYTTPREHYIGLRRIIAARGGADRLLVVNEAPAGIADSSAAWCDPQAPHYLTDTIHLADLPDYWGSPADPFEAKLGNTFNYLAGKVSTALDRRHGLRVMLSHRVWLVLADRLQPPGVERGVTLDHAGETRTGQREVELERMRAALLASHFVKSPYTPLTPSHPLVRLINLVQRDGGQLVFYSPPLTEMEAEYRRLTPSRRREAIDHRALMDEAGAWFVEPRFDYTDDDVPDYLHLCATRRNEYTRALAHAIVERLRATE